MIAVIATSMIAIATAPALEALCDWNRAQAWESRNSRASLGLCKCHPSKIRVGSGQTLRFPDLSFVNRLIALCIHCSMDWSTPD